MDQNTCMNLYDHPREYLKNGNFHRIMRFFPTGFKYDITIFYVVLE